MHLTIEKNIEVWLLDITRTHTGFRKAMIERRTEAEDTDLGVILIRVLTRVWIRKALKGEGEAHSHEGLHSYFQHSFWIHLGKDFQSSSLGTVGESLGIWVRQTQVWVLALPLTRQMTLQVIHFLFQKIEMIILILKCCTEDEILSVVCPAYCPVHSSCLLSVFPFFSSHKYHLLLHSNFSLCLKLNIIVLSETKLVGSNYHQSVLSVHILGLAFLQVFFFSSHI